MGGYVTSDFVRPDVVTILKANNKADLVVVPKPV